MMRLHLRGHPRRHLRRLADSEDGANALEFALVSVPLMLLLVGFFEFAIMAATASAMESAALEGARFGATGAAMPDEALRESKVREIIADRTFGLVDLSKLTIETVVYRGFELIGQPEGYDDTNGNGVFDGGETFQDVNGDGTWNEDQGTAGLGAADDVVVYRLTYPWQPMTGLFAPITSGIVLSSSFPVRNEPFGE
jgi:Flp pilus assembly pilin Flp